jgi:glycerate 2-kinase
MLSQGKARGAPPGSVQAAVHEPTRRSGLDSGRLDVRELLTRLYQAALRAVDPERLVLEALGRRGRGVYVRSVSDPNHREFVFAPTRVALLSLGKAAAPMAVAADQVLGDRVDRALVIGPRGDAFDEVPERYEKIAAGHPHPDAESELAGRAALALAESLGPEDLLLVLLSGGGSALMAAPAPGLSLEDKSKTIALLMAAGAPIAEVNLVRGALSRVKAGRLGRAAGAADVVTLVLSDLGDDGWHLVSSGPTLGAVPSPKDALAILSRYRLHPLVPMEVREALDVPPAAPPETPTGQRWGVLLADIRSALEGARVEALRLGADARVVPELLRGEARAAARRLAVAAARAGNFARHPGAPHRPIVTIFGGETTVTVKGSGRGGRNRELALATACSISGISGACVLVAGTDGIDNEPDAAGGFADGTTLTRAEEKGLDPTTALVENDTAPFFAQLGDAFAPGPTGTNVGDVAFVVARGEPDLAVDA